LLQKKLSEMGLYHGAIDGMFGTETQRAVQRFQSESTELGNPLNSTGVVDTQAWRALGLPVSVAPRPNIPASDAIIGTGDNEIATNSTSSPTWQPLTPEDYIGGIDQFAPRHANRQQLVLQDRANETIIWGLDQYSSGMEYYQKFGCINVTNEQALTALAILVGGVLFASLVIASAGSAALFAGGVFTSAGATTATVTAVKTTALVAANAAGAGAFMITGAEVNEALTRYNPIRDGLLEDALGMSADAANKLYEGVKATIIAVGATVIARGYYYNAMMENAAQTSTGGASGAGNVNADGRPKPPGWTSDWDYIATQERPTDRWLDPIGGEWRWHNEVGHGAGHWDYNDGSGWTNIRIVQP